MDLELKKAELKKDEKPVLAIQRVRVDDFFNDLINKVDLIAELNLQTELKSLKTYKNVNIINEKRMNIVNQLEYVKAQVFQGLELNKEFKNSTSIDNDDSQSSFEYSNKVDERHGYLLRLNLTMPSKSTCIGAVLVLTELTSVRNATFVPADEIKKILNFRSWDYEV